MKEQIILLILGFLLVVVLNTNIFNNWEYCNYINFTLYTLLIAVFINTIQIMYDTGMGIFIIIDMYNDKES